MKQNLTNIFRTFLACLFTFRLHIVTFYFYSFFFCLFFCFAFANLFAPFAFHPFYIRFCFYFSLALERLFRLIFALHLITFLLLYPLLMSFSHTFFAFTSISLHFRTPFPFLNFLSILQYYTKTLCK